MKSNLRKLNSSRFLIIGTLFLTCVGLEYGLHIVYGVTHVYPHAFYLPIAAAAFWWGLKGGASRKFTFRFNAYDSLFRQP